jgi:hypothetical protein
MSKTDNSLATLRTDQMQDICRAIHNSLPDHLGFVVITIPFGAGKDGEWKKNNADYAANINREDAVAALKALLFRWGVEEQWMEQVR